MSCRCCRDTQLDIKYIIFLLIFGCLVFIFSKKISELKKEHIEKEQKAQVV